MSLATEEFCKTKNCPSTEILLLFSVNRLGEIDRGIIGGHLFECEFCCAELQLISLHPPGEPHFAALEIPFQIRRVAEILLGSQAAEFQFLRVLLDGDRFWTHTELPLIA